jgi:hypothetical protein
LASRGAAPELAPGSRLIARTIIGEDGERYYGDPVWSKRLSGAFGGATIADIAGVAAPLACHKEKRALHIKTGAHAADMESHIAARIAAAHKLPFAAFRVVAMSNRLVVPRNITITPLPPKCPQ